ncbi:hypothetical protein RND81_07G089500 [Saponaria officinalis]|uniref:Acid phosphatase n=1 Tax=Saponaria officinalis TaxID=3572 RepID=A0AAW1JND1_SAPOF
MLYQLLFLCYLTITLPHPITSARKPDRLRLPSSRQDETVFCESWRFSVETNDAGNWTVVPSRCKNFVRTYMTGPRYQSDTYFAAEPALSFVRGLNGSGDGLDAWIFSVDDTLISCLPYYELHGFGSEEFNEASFYEWASTADAPPIAASWTLYKELQAREFTIFILSGRHEHFRDITETNLISAGYTHYKRLILRSESDNGKLATDYKSIKRKEIVDEGYTIRGISGDQWSDLLGNSVAQRSFKLPNIMYYIP